MLENTSATVVLKKGRAKSVKNYHPWVYSGAIDRVEGEYQPGDIVRVVSYDGQFQAKGFINPKSQIFLRLLTFRDEPIDAAFFERRIHQAFRQRLRLLPDHTNAFRVVNSDADRLSGLIVDYYNGVVVVQINSRGMDRLRPVLVSALQRIIEPTGILERSESPSRKDEGLSPQKGLLWGEVPDRHPIEENCIKFWVDLKEGQKTGFFLDQRDNRQRIGRLASRHKRLLNLFSYSGGFSVYAALAGIPTISVDISEPALELARENFRLNGLNPDEHQFIVANVFEFLRQTEERYDFVVLDPPAFIKKKRHIAQGTRGYKDINLMAIKKMDSGGVLLSCSCSHYLDWGLFQKVLFAAAQDAERQVQIIGRFGHALDHPVSIFHPEGEYLKAFLVQVMEPLE